MAGASLALGPSGASPAPALAAPVAAGISEPIPEPSAAGPAEVVWIERTRYAMGTRLRAKVAARDRPEAIRASEAAFRAVERAEERLSTWRADTELAGLNGAPPGRAVRLKRPLLGLLLEVRRWSRETAGAIDPAVGALVDAWDLRGAGRRPSLAELDGALGSSGFRCFELDAEAGEAVRRCPGAWLDAGAFGKGAALRGARRALEAAGASAALLDFGGQQLAFGAPYRGEAWTVAVADPSRRARPTIRIRISGGSVATTGQSERAVRAADERLGHVLDPRTGRPVPSWGSVTVVADDPLAADLLSTALFVMGPDAGIEWLRARPEIAALFLVEGDRGLSVRATEAMRRLLADPVPARGADARERPGVQPAHENLDDTF